MKNSKILIVAAALILFVGLSLKIDQEDWKVPPAASKMKNPTDVNDSENIEIGNELYMQHCKSCHGKTGLGDGPKAEELDTPSGDFSSEQVQAQTDGSIFFKIKEGRDDMPGFEKKIPDDEDVWLIVNFIRTFKG